MSEQTNKIKYMTFSETQELKSEIDPKIKTGDYITLGQILDVAPDTARMRYHRDNEEAILSMQKIITARESLIQSVKNNS